MSKGLAFWVLMLVWLVLGWWASGGDRRWVAGGLLIFALLFLLGWQVFGFIIQ